MIVPTATNSPPRVDSKPYCGLALVLAIGGKRYAVISVAMLFWGRSAERRRTVNRDLPATRTSGIGGIDSHWCLSVRIDKCHMHVLKQGGNTHVP